MLQSLLKTTIWLSIFNCLFAFANNEGKQTDIQDMTELRAKKLDVAFASIVEQHQINTAGVAVIKNGNIVWQNYYGQQSDGVPASTDTLFDIASLTKTVTAETILRLVAKGKLSLEEPVADFWLDPDLKNNPYLPQLTPRMLLSHTSGFMNWRFFSDDGKLSFVSAPGTSFGYSGEGYEYLAKYAEKKLKTSFPELVQKEVFSPLKMEDSAIVVDKNNFKRIAKPLDKNGEFYGYYCLPQGYCRKEGRYSAAAGLVITVSDYAKFLISSMKGEGLSAQLKQDRNTMQGVQFSKSDIECGKSSDIICPTQLGYGLGWSVAQLESDKLIGHRGTTWTVVSLAYYYAGSGDGLITFFNAPNKAGIAGMVDALELLDPDSPELLGYRMRRARAN